MGWRTDPVKQRAELMGLIEHGTVSVSSLCAVFSISRKTAYKWLARYRAAGLEGLVDRSHAPRHCPHALAATTAQRIRALRLRYPRFGPKKLRVMLHQHHPDTVVPAASTIGRFLRRAGLSTRARRGPRAHLGSWPALRAITHPNAVWTADFKGDFRLGDGSRCVPLTIADAYSRYLLRNPPLPNMQSQPARRVFDSAFREYGVPDAIRTDNGIPFYTVGPAGLTLLSAWWIKLGITPERIRPGCPQQNGRHERMHRTLKGYCARPPTATRALQQRRHDEFRHFFNTVRPHEALDQQTPASRYRPSHRRYDPTACELIYPGHFERRYVKRRGDILWRGRRLFISQAMVYDPIGLEEIDDGVWRVFFGPVLLGHLLDAELDHGLIHINSRLHDWLVSPILPV
jgi:transposase InsO family protein